MDRLYNMGKDFISHGGHGGSGGHASGLNPMSVFQSFDQNGDGKIGEDDFVAAIHHLGFGSVGDEAVRMAFRQLDTNRNGRLEFMEAISAYNRIQNIFQQSQQ